MLRDLSHPIDSGTPTYPGDPPVSVSPAATHAADGYAVTDLRLGTHAGTHVDAPRHTEPAGATLEEVDVGEFAFDARSVDCRPLDDREPIGPAALPAAADLDAGVDLLVLQTGWAEHWGDDRYRDHPYLTPAAAERCRDLGVGVGLDTFGPDPTPPADGRGKADEPEGVPAHRALLGADLPIVENLRNLGGLPDRVRLYAFPLPVVGGDGSPVRAVAEWDA